MTTWTIKSQTYDPQLALEMVDYQRNRECTAWIEDESGRAIDEEALKMHKVEPTKPKLYERAMGPLVVLASTAVGLSIVYAVGVWVVDR